ncbi:ATP-binding protein [uncultured Desulfobulbus sp.]|uniref:ATP-binding protein n=1 Tax=uncultured Desulfobulbus sp. TaxID=239745 RepID=UPI0029C942DD|nr:ATP-binding protein [uncultured Desulfobulbus sp.]
MLHPSHQIRISKELARKLLPLAVSVFLVISIIIPGAYGALEFRRLEHEATTHSKQLAELIKGVAASSPRLWKFQATKYSQILDDFTPYKGILSILVLDEQARPISQLGHFTKSDSLFNQLGIEGKSAPIVLNNNQIGAIRVRVAAAPILVTAIFVFLLCVLTGTLLSLLLYRVPLRVVVGLEQRLLNYQDSLEELVKKRTTELQDTTSKAEAANKAKSLFLANMSHEIRTPMNAIIGMTHLAMQAKIDGQRQRFLQTVQHSAESLLNLLNDILDFSKMEAGQLQLTPVPFNLGSLLQGIVSTLNIPAVEKGLHLTFSTEENLPTVLIGDDMRLRQILLNLVGNAIKFTRSGSIAINVNGENAEAAPTTLHFTVTDTGIGIPPEKCALIFKSFEQADITHARRFGGTGLGLSICSQLVGLMGGRIWVESQVDAGSSFHFTVALQTAEEHLLIESLGKEKPLQGEIKSLRILVVDDNEVNRDVASMTLEQDHRVATASNGLEALIILAADAFDVILMDVQMPEMDGLAATAVIRALEQGLPPREELPEDLVRDLDKRLRGGHIPIVAMTAHAMGEDRELCLATGMDNYLTKPFQPDQLSEMLRSLEVISLPEQTGKETAADAAAAIDDSDSPVSLAQIAAHLHNTTSLNAAQVDQVLASVCLSLTDNLAKAKEALEAENYPDLGRFAHTLKGTLLQCGLDELAAKAEEIHLGTRTNIDLNHEWLLDQLNSRLAGLIGPKDSAGTN